MLSQKICLKHNQYLSVSEIRDDFGDILNKFEQCVICTSEKQQQAQEVLYVSHNTINMLLKLQSEISHEKYIKIENLENIMSLIKYYIIEIKSERRIYSIKISNKYHFYSAEDDEFINRLEKLNLQIIKELTIFLEEQKNCNVDHLLQLINNLNRKFDQTQYYQKFRSKQLIKTTIQEQQQCSSFAFNKNNTLLFVGQKYGKIKLYGFNNHHKLIKTLQNHIGIIFKLVWMNQNRQLLSGCQDKSIIIWNNEWLPQQVLKGHTDYILCITTNEDESLIISGGEDRSIKFWKKKNLQLICIQTITTEFQIVSLHSQQTKLISCGRRNICVIEFQVNEQWIITKKIETENGIQACFISNNQFIFQPYEEGQLEIFKYEAESNQFILKKYLLLSNYQDISQSFFPYYFIKELNCLIAKHNQYTLVFRLQQSDVLILQQSIEFDYEYQFTNTVGIITQNGQYQVTQDKRSRIIQVMQFRDLN